MLSSRLTEVIVYLLFCRETGKYYVGQTTTTMEKRWQLHLNGYCNPHLKRAIKKYGRESFELKLLADCKTRYEMNQIERLWIAVLRSANHRFGYNVRVGGNSVHNVATKRKIARSKRGKYLSKRTRKRISAGMKRYWRRVQSRKFR